MSIDIKFVDIPASDNLTVFRIGKYPVTNAQYKAFVEATGYKEPRHWKNGSFPPGKADHPVVYVSWHDAAAFCAWAGCRLPTEEEWEHAATGGDGREYPWGDKFDAAKCNTWEGGIRSTTPVGIYSPDGDSPFGVADMAGNVWEWTTSEWGPGSDRRVVRGGSWCDHLGSARCAVRFRGIPDGFDDSLGFRVVVSLASRSSDS